MSATLIFILVVIIIIAALGLTVFFLAKANKRHKVNEKRYQSMLNVAHAKEATENEIDKERKDSNIIDFFNRNN